MKLGIIFPLTLVAMGCGSAPAKPSTAFSVQAASIEVPDQDNAHLVWCPTADDCFTLAATFCGVAKGGSGQHVTPGRFHPVAEKGYEYPAMIQETNGWRMLIVCDP